VAAFANTPEVRRQMWDQMLRGFSLHALLVNGVVSEAAASGTVRPAA